MKMSQAPNKRIPPELLEASSRTHTRVCPRQVLGLRIGMAAGPALGLELPRQDKRLIALVETDGCTVDGINAATGCSVGRRTMFIQDYGKVAAVFVDRETGRAVRIAPQAGCRDAACDTYPEAESRWHAQLEGYQTLPDDTLLAIQPVTVSLCLDTLISEPGKRTLCQTCGEEIMNGREVIAEGRRLCRACAGETYYKPLVEAPPVHPPD